MTGHNRTAVARPLPRTFHAWLGASSLSTLGDAALFFALGWMASGIGAGFAGLVLTAVVLPRVAFVLVGGAVGDRWGARRVLLAGQLTLCVLTAGLAIAAGSAPLPVWSLLATAAVLGLVDAFCLPCNGSYPRLLVADDQLPRAMALRGSANQAVTLVGGPLSGALIAAVGLPGAALADCLTFAVFAVCLVLVRPVFAAAAAPSVSIAASVRAGLSTAVSVPQLRAMLLAVGLVAGFVLPMMSLCLPLLVRDRHGGPQLAGTAAGAMAAGALLVSLLVAARGGFRRPGLALAVGPFVAGAGMAGMTLSGGAVGTIGSALVQGVGVGMFTAHLSPLFAVASPRAQLTRLQSILSLVQSVPLLFANPLLGLIASYGGARSAGAVCAAGTVAAGVLLVSDPRIRDLPAPGG